MAETVTAEANSRRAWPDWAVALALVAIAAALHGWMVSHSEVMARDSIGYIRYALRIEDGSWSEAVAGMKQHPGYPTFLLLVSYPVRWFLGTTPDSMVLSAQLANALAAVLLAVPLYYLAREFFGRREAFAAALLFQVLPVSLQVTSDALSEGLYLLLALTSLCWTAQGLRRQSIWRFALAGLAGGLAYLTRPEGALVVLVGGGVLLAAQCLPDYRWPWRRLAAGLSCLGLAAMLGGSPYPAATGSITKKPTALQMFKVQPRKFGGKQSQLESTAPAPDRMAGFTRSPVLAQVLAMWWPEGNQARPPLTWCMWAVLSETARTLQYVLVFFLLIGLGSCGPWLRLPQTWLLLAVVLLHVVILVWLALTMGYVSERHTLLMAACCTMPATLGLHKLAERLQDWLPWRSLTAGRLGMILCLVVVGGLLTSAIRPLHANRAGHRAAGHWLAEHARPYDEILDPFCWAHYFAGHVLLEGKKPAPPPGSEPASYVIVERSQLAHSRLKDLQDARELADQGTRVYRWEPSGRLKKHAEVVEVYAVPSHLTQSSDNDG